MRLNDLLNHPNGTEGVISIDRAEYKLCIRLPNQDHTLSVWFLEQRDFLVSVCIIRKSGFKVEAGSFIQNSDISPKKANSSHKSAESRTSDAPRLSSITSLSTLAAQAKAFCTESFSSNPSGKVVEPPSQTIFDEVLERLRKTRADGAVQDATGEDTKSAQVEPDDLLYLNPYNVFSTKKTIKFNQPNVGSPLKNVVHQEQHVHEEIENLSCRTLTASDRRSNHHHRHFTRSFSSSYSKTTRNNLSSSSNLQRTSSSIPVNGPDIRFVTPALSSSFDSDSSTDFRQLMPQRRKLPFIEYTQTVNKKSKTAIKAAQINKQRNVPERQSQETTVMLMHNSSLDKLHKVSCTIFDQYEQDIFSGYGDERVAEFYLERLHEVRTNFWLKELTKASEGGYLRIVDI